MPQKVNHHNEQQQNEALSAMSLGKRMEWLDNSQEYLTEQQLDEVVKDKIFEKTGCQPWLSPEG